MNRIFEVAFVMLILMTGWAIYFTLHSVLASAESKRQFAKMFPRLPSRYYRIFYNIFFLAGIIILLFYQLTIHSVLLFVPSLAVKIFAGIMVGGGFAMMALTIKNYDTKSFLGLADVHSEPLRVKGLNRYMRHPLYTGTSVFVIGLFLFMPYYKHFYFLIVYFVYLFIGMELEEKKLVEVYGEAYREYQRKVKKLIPKLW